MTQAPDDIVGHKTFDTGEICPETGFPKLRHEPLTRAEANAIWEASDKAQRDRAERMPDEQSAINAMFDAYQRLSELGWCDPSYCPKDGKHFKVIEPGSTGIFDCSYHGEWPNGSWWLYDGDVWPSRPVMFRLYPEDQAKEDERWRKVKEKFQARATATLGSDGDNSSAVETAASSDDPTTGISNAVESSASGLGAEVSSALSSHDRAGE